MRIRAVRFKNLNSLAGEWLIDLADPAFTGDGIFAITGPTGAGKTTILDAICLALYGRTPRLERVNKAGNEIMSRQAGECFAEVTFEAAGVVYRCYWGQHRARRRPEGDLQPSRQEIADAGTGEVLESSIRGVAEKVEEVTGMDYDRFTRSMLLAQGGFAAFLQAAPDERAPILEQITGTDIYSRISMEVHRRKGEEEQRLKALKARMEGMQSLSAEEVAELETRLEALGRQSEALAGQQRQTQAALDWLDGLARLELELTELAEHQRLLEQESEAFEPDRLRLEGAQKALELSAAHTALAALRAQQQSDEAQLRELEQRRPEQESRCRAMGRELDTARTRREDAAASYRTLRPTLQQVRGLDQEILQRQQNLRETVGEHHHQHSLLRELGTSLEQTSAARETKEKTLADLLEKIDSRRQDEELVSQFAAIETRFAEYASLREQSRTHKRELEQARDGHKSSEVEAAEFRRKTAGLKELHRSLETRHRAAMERLVTLLEGRKVAQWREQEQGLQQRLEQLRRLSEALAERHGGRARLAAIGGELARLQQTTGEAADRLRALAETRRAVERERDLLETQSTLLNKIASFDEARLELEDGKPCPLCGAEEHPYAEGNVPDTDTAQRELAAVREKLEATGDEQTRLHLQQGKLERDIEQLTAEEQTLQTRAAELADLISTACEVLELEDGEADLLPTIARTRQEATASLDRARAILAAEADLGEQVAALHAELEQAQQALHLQERQQHEAEHRLALAHERVAQSERQLTQCNGRLGGCFETLRHTLAGFGLTLEAGADTAPLLESLRHRRDTWLERQHSKAKLESDLVQLSTRIEQYREQLIHQQAVAEQWQQRVRTQELELEQRRAARTTVFGDRDPDAEERKAQAEQEDAERIFESGRKALEEVQRELNTLERAAAALGQTVSRRRSELENAARAFSRACESAGFGDESGYLDACLPEEQRRALSRRRDGLALEVARLHARTEEKQQRLEHEKARQLTESPRQEVAARLRALEAAHHNLMDERGAARQRLQNHHALQARQRETLEAIEAQQIENERWSLLHALIGSADGKKFRNFAQGITFEMMVGHANRQLQRMSDRYLLVRDQAQPLELNVIDNYQAGEVRTTKNLSGGESFIVSLALALGLSNMASRRVRVDSLFLDEGFGTLDEDALDTALETLASLNQDGKLVGVISHVEALKERIPTRIQVVPRSGGRSVLHGPGCRSVE